MSLSRRTFVQAGVAMTPAALVAGCGSAGAKDYESAVRAIRAPLPAEPGQRDLVRFATLAPNSHNTQPWKFRLGADSVDILPDLSRRTPVVDPYDHHLNVTLGCAAENLLIAAKASGHSAEAAFDQGGVKVSLARRAGAAADKALCDAIPLRQSTKSEYETAQLTSAELRALENAAAIPGVNLILLTDQSKLKEALPFVQEGNSAQMDDPAFVRELKDWIRYNPAAAVASGDGLFGGCSGNPSAPNWLGPFIFDFTFEKKAENDKLAKQLLSSSGLAVFFADEENP